MKPYLPETTLAMHSVVNPFNSHLQFELVGDANKRLNIDLVDMSGRIVRKISEPASRGVNRYSIDGTGNLAPGIYTLRIISDGIIIQEKVLKQNHE